MMRIVDPILMEIDQEAATTRRVLERVPDDQLDFKPHPKSMSLGQLALHIATLPALVADIIQQTTFEVPKFEQPSARSAAELVPALEASVAHAKEVLNAFDDDGVRATWTLSRAGTVLMSAPRVGVIRSVLLNHWYHHRGQLSVYLRLLDVAVPSIYGPSADENPFETQMAAGT